MILLNAICTAGQSAHTRAQLTMLEAHAQPTMFEAHAQPTDSAVVCYFFPALGPVRISTFKAGQYHHLSFGRSFIYMY